MPLCTGDNVEEKNAAMSVTEVVNLVVILDITSGSWQQHHYTEHNLLQRSIKIKLDYTSAWLDELRGVMVPKEWLSGYYCKALQVLGLELPLDKRPRKVISFQEIRVFVFLLLIIQVRLNFHTQMDGLPFFPPTFYLSYHCMLLNAWCQQ